MQRTGAGHITLRKEGELLKGERYETKSTKIAIAVSDVGAGVEPCAARSLGGG